MRKQHNGGKEQMKDTVWAEETGGKWKMQKLSQGKYNKTTKSYQNKIRSQNLNIENTSSYKQINPEHNSNGNEDGWNQIKDQINKKNTKSTKTLGARLRSMTFFKTILSVTITGKQRGQTHNHSVIIHNTTEGEVKTIKMQINSITCFI